LGPLSAPYSNSDETRQDSLAHGRVITNNIGDRKIFERAQAIGVIDEAIAV
jgi:hypothetical protein